VTINNFSGKNNWTVSITQATSSASGSFDRTLSLIATTDGSSASGTYTSSNTSLTFHYKVTNTGDLPVPASATLTAKDSLFQGNTGNYHLCRHQRSSEGRIAGLRDKQLHTPAGRSCS
jgi:hypothetical protein